MTIFITGASSGIGKATVEKFLKEGWNVVATIHTNKRNPFSPHKKLLVVELDVTHEKQIQYAYTKAIETFGSVDVLVNNAGYGLLGPIEELTLEEIKEQFIVNVFGLLAVTKKFLPHFRTNRKGVIINISSMYGKISMPYFSVYAATKHAIEGLSESLAQELEGTHVQVKIIEPGAIQTNFFTNAKIAQTLHISKYNPRFQSFIKNISEKGNHGDSPNLVSEAIYRAATDNSSRLRYVTDKTAHLLLNLHRFLPFQLYTKAIQNNIG